MTDEQAFNMIMEKIDDKASAEADIYFYQGYAQEEGVKQILDDIPEIVPLVRDAFQAAYVAATARTLFVFFKAGVGVEFDMSTSDTAH